MNPKNTWVRNSTLTGILVMHIIIHVASCWLTWTSPLRSSTLMWARPWCLMHPTIFQARTYEFIKQNRSLTKSLVRTLVLMEANR